MEIRDFEYLFHDTKGDIRADFKPSDEDEENTSPRYYGLVDLAGRYLIIRQTNSSGIKTFRVAYGRSGYTTAWTGRGSLDYYYWFQLKDIV